MILATVISVGPNHLENKNCPDRFLHLFGCQAASKFPSKPQCVTWSHRLRVAMCLCCVFLRERERQTRHIALCIAIILIFKHWRARKQTGNSCCRNSIILLSLKHTNTCFIWINRKHSTSASYAILLFPNVLLCLLDYNTSYSYTMQLACN